MQDSFSRKIQQLWNIKEEYKLKVFLLSLTFLLMTACLAIWRPLKVSVFAKMVGPEQVPNAKMWGLMLLIPLILFYSKLIDVLRRHQLLYCFTIFHGIGGIIFYILLSDQSCGIANTIVDTNRLTGWAFYFFMESFDAFFATSFWSFADSVNSPKDARNFYGYFVTGSKIGGMLGSGLLYLAITYGSSAACVLLPNALLSGSIMLFAAAYSIMRLIKKVPENIMHGYEAVYKIETKKERPQKGIIAAITSALEGLIVTIKNPYVSGILSLVVFYEVVIVVFDYIVMIQANNSHGSVEGLTAFYATYYFNMNAIGLAIALFGTTPILRILGLRHSLLAYPILTILLLTATALSGFKWAFYITLVGLRALNYALNHPTREVLYIPTVKDIKFKAKTWTDAFGSRSGKFAGSVFNKFMWQNASSLATQASIFLSIGLTSTCLVISYFLGRTFQHAVTNKKVIGASSDSTEKAESFDLE